MHTPVASHTGNVTVLPTARPAAVDPQAVVLPAADVSLSYGELDSWSNRLARLLLEIGAGPGIRVAIAVDEPVEAVVAERAVVKIGAIPMAMGEGESTAFGTGIGVTTKQERPHLDDRISWLVLDDRSTLQRYLAGSDQPLTEADFAVVARSA
ncbi:AMP-binding protein [Nocardia cyriacigeorgica]|uniref:AMP-binding protein n=1 Tax=Nocardia cyriacigeorgica TaxID=135487 RepID=UPI0024548225|nr:AMP-binding protein [Nocardia cyriacigeorgica]